MAAIEEDLFIKLRIAYHICLVVGHCLAVFVGAISRADQKVSAAWSFDLKKDLIVLTLGGVAI